MQLAPNVVPAKRCYNRRRSLVGVMYQPERYRPRRHDFGFDGGVDRVSRAIAARLHHQFGKRLQKDDVVSGLMLSLHIVPPAGDSCGEAPIGPEAIVSSSGVGSVCRDAQAKPLIPGLIEGTALQSCACIINQLYLVASKLGGAGRPHSVSI